MSFGSMTGYGMWGTLGFFNMVLVWALLILSIAALVKYINKK